MALCIILCLHLAHALSNSDKQTCAWADAATRATRRREDIQFIQFRNQRSRFEESPLLEDLENQLVELAASAGPDVSGIGSVHASVGRLTQESTGTFVGQPSSELVANAEQVDDAGFGHQFLAEEGDLESGSQQLISLLAHSQGATDAVEQLLMKDGSTFKQPLEVQNFTPAGNDECGFIAEPSCERMLSHSCTSPSSLSKFCPKACNYIVVDPLFHCQAACVQPQKCDLAGSGAAYDNPETHTCEQGPISGCMRYSQPVNKSGVLVPRTCHECSDYFIQEGGECTFMPDYRRVAGIVLLSVMVILAILLPINLYRWCCLPLGNVPALRSGWDHRLRCLLSTNDYEDPTKLGGLYPVDTDMHKESIAGGGLCLFYNSLTFLFGVALIVAGTTTVLYYTSPYSGSGMEDAEACDTEQLQRAAKALKSQHERYAYAFGALWLVLLVFSVAYARYQHLAFRGIDEGTSLMSDFASRAVGFPPDADEAEIKSFFDSVAPNTVIGVSLAYDYRRYASTVQDLLARHLHDQDVKQGFTQTNMDLFNPSDEERRGIEHMLRSMRGSGTAFPVCRTEDDVSKMMEAVNENKPLFRGTWPIEMEEIQEEPSTYFWMNFAYNRKDHVINIVIEIFVLLFEGLILALVLFAPAAYFMYNYNKAKGLEESSLSGAATNMVMGLLITVMNLILYFLVDKGSRRIGFYYKVDIDRCNLIGATVIVGLATIFDIFLAIQAVESTKSNVNQKLFEGQTHEQRSIRAESIDMTVAKKIFQLLVPFVLVLPDLVGRFIKYVLSAQAMFQYWISLPGIKWDMRSNVNLKTTEAERGLLPTPMQIEFDYANSICIFGTVFLLMMFPGYKMVVVSWILVGWVLMTYASLKYCHLRFNMFTEYTSCFLDDCATVLWSIPLSMIAGIAAHWAQKAWHLHWSIQPLVFFIALINYVVLVGVVMSYVSPYDDSGGEDFAQCLQRLRYDYFNTNPIFVLKSQYLKGYGPPLVYFSRGKEYLQKGETFDKVSSFCGRRLVQRKGC